MGNLYNCHDNKTKNDSSASKKRRSTRNRKKKVSYKESNSDDDNDGNYRNGHHHHHNTRSKSKAAKSHKKRKKNKGKRSKHHKDQDDDIDNESENGNNYDINGRVNIEPKSTYYSDDNSDIDINMINNGQIYDNHHQNSKIKIEGGIDDIFNGYNKRRKINGTQYIKTNGIDINWKPNTFNIAPKQRWFPSINQSFSENVNNNDNTNLNKNGKKSQKKKHKIDNKNNHNNIGPEAELQIFAQNCFNMLQFREWVCIGYQTQYIEQNEK